MYRPALVLLATVLWTPALAAGGARVSPATGSASSRTSLSAATSPGQWTWAGGSDRIAELERVGVYGTKGVPGPENVPGARYGAVTWVDPAGNFWLFGGRGYARHALIGMLNDLWKWDGASWTWVSGSSGYGGRGTYGDKGVAASGNEPGARYDAVSWIDAAGNLWLFGGYGRDATSSFDDSLSDLWKWDGASWTWMSGPSVGHQQGVYGTIGVPAPENRPGARWQATAWSAPDGSFWLFGGSGRSAYSSGDLNDLWKWNGQAWTWMGGSNIPDQFGSYGSKGIANPTNVPGGRSSASASVGPDGSVRLFGGYGRSASGRGSLNDLWTWNGAGWVWVGGSDAPDQQGVYGAKGVAAPENVPGARSDAVAWADASGRFYLLGGSCRLAPDSDASLGDLWMWNGVAWTWVGGTATPDQAGTYGVRGLPGAANLPGARRRANASRDAAGNVYLFGGDGALSTGRIGHLNDLWRWNGSEWTWLSGTDGASLVGVYGTKGVPSPANHPGARRGAVTWHAANGETWLFGGHGYSATGLGYMNDLWRWDGSVWTWVGGTNATDQPAIPGTKGVPAEGNVPGARAWGTSWMDSAGHLWLFGGSCPDPYDEGLLNDLWTWDGTTWTWVSGSLVPGRAGNYGTKGVPSPSNVPGARSVAAAWTDPAGAFWLFGGDGVTDSDRGDLNDLWRWDGTNWTWMHGPKTTNDSGSYGALGVPSPANVPESRAGAVASAGADGTVWMYGGAWQNYYLHDDLWRWDGTSWTWMGGTPWYSANGVYGVKGVTAPENKPGARAWGQSWIDDRGHFWLFGGYGSTDFGREYLNDLWRWDGARWTWMSGANAPDAAGVYGVSGTPAAGNTPGARDTAFSWRDTAGRLWVMNGFGVDSIGVAGRLSDLWVWEVPDCTPPPATMTAPGSVVEGSGAHTASVTAAGVAATYEWTISGGTIDSGQGTPSIVFSAAWGEPRVVVAVVVREGLCASSDEKTIPVDLYQRLEVVVNGDGEVQVLAGTYDGSCATRCEILIPSRTSVQLSALASASSRFVGWLGGSCGSAASCTFAMSGPLAVSANFFQNAPAGFYPVTPCRVADTRNAAGPYGAPALAAGASRAFTVGGTCGIPADAAAVALNVTVVGPTDTGSLTLYPGTGPAPNTGAIAFVPGRIRAEQVTMGLAGGVFSILDRQGAGTVDVVLDVSGYFR